MSTKLYVATKNENKLREIKQILKDCDVDVRSATEVVDMDVPETESSFLGNASLKARELSKRIDGYVIADDSGLSVDILEGDPGVYSARFAGYDATDEQNNQKLLAIMSDVPEEARLASFICVIALAKNGLILRTFSGMCEGNIAREPKGGGGFGYDPLFLLDDGRSMAELTPEEKNRISHRSAALGELRAYIEENGLTE